MSTIHIMYSNRLNGLQVLKLHHSPTLPFWYAGTYGRKASRARRPEADRAGQSDTPTPTRGKTRRKPSK